MKTKCHSAFTLIELLVVVAIITILAALLLPALKEAVESARIVACMNQHKQSGVMLQTYASDHRGWIPNEDRRGVRRDYWHEFLWKTSDYMQGRERDLLVCPVVKPFRWDDTNRRTIGGRMEKNSSMMADVRSMSPPNDGDNHFYFQARSLQSPSKWIYLADTWHCSNWEQTARWQSYSNNLRLHTRHRNRANVWMVDGHVELAGGDELYREYGISKYVDEAYVKWKDGAPE